VRNKDPEHSEKDKEKDEDEKLYERLQHLNTISPPVFDWVSKKLDSVWENIPIHNLLMISGCDKNNNNQIHVMYIKDIQKYTKLHICPKCGYIPPATSHGTCYRKDRFEEHVNNCEGKLSRSICLNEQSIPFIPHVQKNPIFAYLLAHNRKNEYRVIQEYITYDFETVMKKKIKYLIKLLLMHNNYLCL
jgi:hypothetical protein